MTGINDSLFVNVPKEAVMTLQYGAGSVEFYSCDSKTPW